MESFSMFNLRTAIKILIVLLTISSCSNTQESKESNEEQQMIDIQALNTQLDEIELLCKNLVTNDYMSFFHEEAIIFPPGQSPIKGIEAIREFYSVFEKVFVPSFDLVYSERYFEVEDSLAIRRYNGYAKIFYKDNSDTLISNNKYVDMVKKQPDGSWKIIWHMWNENKPIQD